MRTYTTARTLFSFVEFISWVAVVVGIIGAIAAFTVASDSGFRQLRHITGMMAAAPFVAFSLLGLLGVVLVQLGRAEVDTAAMTGQLLDLSKKQTKIMAASYLGRERSPAAPSASAFAAGEAIDWPDPDDDKKPSDQATSEVSDPVEMAEPIIRESTDRFTEDKPVPHSVTDWPTFDGSVSIRQTRSKPVEADPDLHRPPPSPLSGNPSVVWPMPPPSEETPTPIPSADIEIEISNEEFEVMLRETDRG